MKKTVLLILVVAFSLSCKDESKKTDNVDSIIEEVVVKESPKLLVVLNATVLVDDVFEVYFYEEGQEKFHPKDFVSLKVKGNPDPQELVFELPDNIYPERLRLDVGKTPKQKMISLKSVSMVFDEKEYVFTKEELTNEFKPSKFIDFNKEDLTLNTKAIDGKYDPYFYTKKVSNIVNYLLED